MAFAPDVNNSVFRLVIQPDGRILICGEFTTVGGLSRRTIARLNSDGSVDPNFHSADIADVRTIVIDSDGRFLVGGLFTSVGGQNRQFAARLNPDGSLDTSFNLIVDGPVYQFTLLPDGKMYICGFFRIVNGTTSTTVARIAPDGSTDSSFGNVNIPSGNVTEVAVQSDGKVMVAGDFSRVGGQDREDVARVGADGAIDITFTDPNTNFGGSFSELHSLLVQPDGNILIGGRFTMIGGQPRRNVVRLRPDGGLDLPPARLLTVNKLADTDDGVCDADCSLREAVAAANSFAEASSIGFDAAVFSGPQTIMLALGELIISDNRRVTVLGPGAALLTISGNNTSRILRLLRDTDVTVIGLTFSNGNGVGAGFGSGDGGAIYVEPFGVRTRLVVRDSVISGNRATNIGAIAATGSFSTLIIENSTISGNEAGTVGGIGRHSGSMTISNSTITNNIATSQTFGIGGIDVRVGTPNLVITGSVISDNSGYTGGLRSTGTALISNTIFTNNVGLAQGGGISVSGGTMTLTASTVSNNVVTGSSGNGGGIQNTSGLNIVNSIVRNNSASFGGGIYGSGGLSVSGSRVEDNIATSGAGIYNNSGGSTGVPVTLSNSVVNNNAAASFGGGIYNRDLLNVINSTLSNNRSGTNGGGAFNVLQNGVGAGTMNVTSSTFTGNFSSAAGGGLANQTGTVTLKNATVSGNTASGLGGALSNNGGTINISSSTIASNLTGPGSNGAVNNSSSVINVANSIIADNDAGGVGSEIAGVITSGGYNLIENTPNGTITGVSTGNILGQDPLLGALANNGGPTHTSALLAGSPAVDAGNSSGATSDQRGSTRPADFPGIPNASDGADIGAFEVQTAPVSGPRALFDFDGDNKTDLSIFRPGPGEWWINRSLNGSTFALQFGAGTDRIAPADFTGDGKTDVAFFRPSTGQWFVLRSEDLSFYAFPFGTNGDVPVPADYDADGKADAAVFRPSTLTWFIQKSGGGTDIIGFGAAGDVPTVADYDGDAKADIAIYRPNAAGGAQWWVRRSSNGTVFALQFGTPTDKTVQGDYTGDGKADIAFWRPSTGGWFVLRSEDFSFYSFPFGTNGDTPVPGDYDGDGRNDAAVFRPSTSTWFAQRSTGGTLIQQFGIAGDIPLPSAYVR